MMMCNEFPPIFLPTRGAPADPQAGDAIAAALTDAVQTIRRALGPESAVPAPAVPRPASADAVLHLLTGRAFSPEARGRVRAQIAALQAPVAAHLAAGRPLPFFYLYHGGYRAAGAADNRGLVFAPDQTDVMTLARIATLQEQLAAIHPPGIRFVIVLNNGVATWTNGIDRALTESYGHRLRAMIARLGIGERVSVLVQSELPGHSDAFCPDLPDRLPELTPEAHAIVERFLDRACPLEEARRLSALYVLAEAAWAERLAPLTASAGAVVLRQVPHPKTLCFRPYAGGSIRVQNGTLGFRLEGGRAQPVLVTARSHERHRIVPLGLPPDLAADVFGEVAG